MIVVLYIFFALCFLPIVVLIFTPDTYQSFRKSSAILMLIYAPVWIPSLVEIRAIVYITIIVGTAIFVKFLAINFYQKYKLRLSIRLLLKSIGLIGPVLYFLLKEDIDNLLGF